MAFNINKRQAAPTDGEGEGSSTTPDSTKPSNVVATQSWVRHLLDKFREWRISFMTGQLQVTGQTQTGTLQSGAILTNGITTNRLTILDENGKPMIVYIKDGKLVCEYKFEDIFLYPGNGVTIKSFFVLPDESMKTALSGTAKEVMNRFLPVQDPCFTMMNGNTCFKLCDSDGKHLRTPKTLLVTCGEDKKITALKVCDDGLNLIRRIELPENTGVNKLTINLPVITGEDEPTFPLLPSNNACANCPQCGKCSHGGNLPGFPDALPPFPPFVGGYPIPLNANLFNDDPISVNISCNCGEGNKPLMIEDLCCEGAEDYINVGGRIVELGTSREPVEVGADTETDPVEEGVQYVNFVTDTYSNIVLRRDDFERDRRQFLVFETRSVEG